MTHDSLTHLTHKTSVLVVDRMFRQQIEVYLKYNKRNKLSTASGLSDFVKHLQDTYQLTLTSVGKGSLISPRLILNSFVS